jgi:hypothetical protein
MLVIGAMNDLDISPAQRDICKRFGADPVAAPADLKVGIARNVRDGIAPVNGLRHSPQGDTTGWYIWAGDEPSDDPDFFVPLHVDHLSEWCADVLPYLALPPGWRFQIAKEHEDVWEDETLLGV